MATHNDFIYERTISEQARNDYAMLRAYLYAHIDRCNLTLDLTTHECYTDMKTIFLGYKATEYFGISILDALLHEIYHNILPKPVEYEKYTVDQVNLCEDLEINSKLGLNEPGMNVKHPSKMGLSVGLKTIEYLRLLFPDQENKSSDKDSGDGPDEEQFGDQFLDGSDDCGHSSESDPGEMYKRPSEESKAKTKISVEFKPKPLNDPRIIEFLLEAKNKAQTYLFSKHIEKTYRKLSRRSHDPRIITPGVKKTGGDPSKLARTPVLFLDNSTSMNNQIPLAESIMDFVRNDFCIMLYSDKPGWKFKPGERNISFVPVGGTSIYKSAVKIIREEGDSIGDFYIITDGDDDSIHKAASYIRDLGREFHVLKIESGRVSRRLKV